MDANEARRDAANYPLRFVTRALYSDMDANRHINNVAFSRWFEEGRAQLNAQVFGVGVLVDPPPGQQMLLASTHIDFLAPLNYPANVTVATAVIRIGTSSYTIAQAVFDDAGRCHAVGECAMVRARDGRAVPLDDDQRAAVSRWLLADPNAA